MHGGGLIGEIQVQCLEGSRGEKYYSAGRSVGLCQAGEYVEGEIWVDGVRCVRKLIGMVLAGLLKILYSRRTEALFKGYAVHMTD